MKNLKFIVIIILALCQNTNAQNGTIEAIEGVIVGDNSGTVNGTIRYNAGDFQGRADGIWRSLTEGSTPWTINGSKTYYDLGNVGIGETDPLVELHINGSHEMLRLSGTSPWLALRETGQANYAYNWMSGGNFNLGVTGDHDINFNTSGAQRMIIKDDGNIGIGTSTPNAKLEIEADLEALRLNGTTPWISFYDGATYNGYVYHSGTNMSVFNRVNGNLTFGTNNGVRMAINPDGNVGLGTLIANAKLDVRGSAIFNENGVNADFRVEGENDNNMMFVDASTDRIGIGTNSPNAKLDVRGSVIFNEEGNDNDFRVETDFFTHMFFIDASANKIGINTNTPNNLLDVDGRLGLGSTEYIEDGGSNSIAFNGDVRPKFNGIYDLGNPNEKWVNVWASNGTIQTSDRNLKKEIQPLNYGLEEVMKLNPVKFKWNSGNDDSYKLGLIAQEILPVINEVVKTHNYVQSDDSGAIEKVELENLGVYYSDLIPVLINAIQEQQAQIEELKNQINKR